MLDSEARNRSYDKCRSPFDNPFLRLTLYALALLALSGQRVGYAGKAKEVEEGEKPLQHNSIEAVLEQHNDQLMSLPGVVGTAIGECAGRPCIKVLAGKKTPELLKNVPQTLEGFPVIIEETGEFRPLRSG